MDSRPEALLFDVNETLLDLNGLHPHFTRVLGSAELMGEWFARLLHRSLVANELERYEPFDDLAVEALLGVARRRHLELGPDAARSVVDAMSSLPLHPEVRPALEGLRRHGYTMVAVTNNSRGVLSEQLSSAGIDELFHLAFSVEEVGRFKPAAEVYRTAAARVDVEPAWAMMVAAHDWDILGARYAGLPGAFVSRPGAVWSLADPPPGLVVSDLTGLVQSLV
jgi:2-haloacid dehalogenase